MKNISLIILMILASPAFSNPSDKVISNDSISTSTTPLDACDLTTWSFFHDCILFSPDSFRFDNDVLNPFDNDDQNYTYGLIWSWKNHKARAHVLHTEWIQNLLLNKWLHPGKELTPGKYDYNDQFGIQIGITNFTPDELPAIKVMDQDRPYANLMFVHSDVYRLFDDNKKAIGVGITYGRLGGGLGGAIQAADHKLMREIFNKDTPKNPNGWDNQISNGGQLTGKIDVSYHQSIPTPFNNLDAAWTIDASVGYYTYTSIALTARLGHINNNMLPNDLNNLGSAVRAGDKMSIALSDSDKNESNRKRDDEYFVFASVRPVYMVYNALLQCISKSNSNFCIDDKKIVNLIWEATLGIKFPMFEIFDAGEATNITWDINWRTKEHKLDERRTHIWGGLTFEWLF